MLAWMLYVIMVSLLLSIGAFVAERAARLKRGRHALDLDHGHRRVAGVADAHLFGVVRVAQRLDAARSRRRWSCCARPPRRRSRRSMWISGSAAEPAGWRDFDSLADNALARGFRRHAAGAHRQRRASVHAQAPLATRTRSRARRSTSPMTSGPRWWACCGRASSCRAG